MNSSRAKHFSCIANALEFANNMLVVTLVDGRIIGVPLDYFPVLRDADENDRNSWRFIGGGIGIHWQTLDEDISVEGLLKMN